MHSKLHKLFIESKITQFKVRMVEMPLRGEESNVVNKAHAFAWNSTFLHGRSFPRASLYHAAVWNLMHLRGVGAQLVDLLIFGPFQALFSGGL